MAKRIGERLVDRGLVTRQQLAQALKLQLISGGHLGTTLIELGYLDEDALGEELAAWHRMRYASRELLADVPPAALAVMTPEIVEKYRVVPIGVSGRTLNVATMNPRDVASLSQLTGYRVVGWIAPEFRILEAMERFYRIPRRERYIKLADQLELPRRAAQRPVFSPLEEAALHAVPAQRVAIASVAEPPAAAEEIGTVVHERSWRDIAERTEPGADVLLPPPAEQPEEPDWSFEEVAFLMSHADTRADLSSVVLSHVERTFPRCILFGVRAEVAYVWDSRGYGQAAGAIAKLEFPIDSGSVFELLWGNELYRGAVPRSDGCKRFYAALERPAPAEVLLLPTHLNDRLVGVLYAENDAPDAPGTVEHYPALMQKLALALNMIILKIKIRAV